MNILIRPLSIDDAAISYKWRNNPEIWKHTGAQYSTEISEEIESDWLKGTLGDVSKSRFAILVDHEYVGNVQLTDIQVKDTAQFHIFIGNQAYWGKGVAKEATYQILVYAKEVLQLRSVFLEVKEENIAAVKAYEKNGFIVTDTTNDFLIMNCNLQHLPPPMVSIFCLVYNHEPFIAQTLEGFLMQKNNFTTQIVLGEDCSTDGSRTVILEYAQKYPGKFKLLLHDANIGALNNQQMVFEHCDGKYIAMCEGDDYWTDPLKLQKQVDFLENNPDYGLVHSDINSYHQLNGEIKCNQNKETINNNESFTKDQLFDSLINGKYVIRTATVLFRAEYLNLNKSDKNFVMGDTPLWLNISQVTKFKYFDEVLATYRILTESASKSKDKKKLNRFRLSMIEMRIYYFNKFNYTIDAALKNNYNKSLLNYLLKYDKDYQPLFPLFNPSQFENLKLKYNKNIFFRCILNVISKSNEAIKVIYRKIKNK